MALSDQLTALAAKTRAVASGISGLVLANRAHKLKAVTLPHAA